MHKSVYRYLFQKIITLTSTLMSTRQAKQIAKQYSKVLQSEHIPFSHMYLFGSRAKGTERSDSDIDIAVILKGKQKDIFDMHMRLARLALGVDMRIEPIVLEKGDFKKGEESMLAHEVQEYGIRIV